MGHHGRHADERKLCLATEERREGRPCALVNDAGNLRAAIEPFESAGDHQVNDEEQIAFELPYQPLAKPAQREDLLAVGVIDRRIERADKERTG